MSARNADHPAQSANIAPQGVFLLTLLIGNQIEAMLA